MHYKRHVIKSLGNNNNLIEIMVYGTPREHPYTDKQLRKILGYNNLSSGLRMVLSSDCILFTCLEYTWQCPVLLVDGIHCQALPQQLGPHYSP